jgi:hypothetical protein
LAAFPANAMSELGALIDPNWIKQALQATGKASIRRRRLPADHAVWLVIGLTLFRHMPLWQVVQELALTLDGQALPVPSSSVQARQRLGAEPLATCLHNSRRLEVERIRCILSHYACRLLMA